MSVNLKGPLFDGRAEMAVKAATEQMQVRVAEHGVRLVQANLGSVLKNPTGNYQSHITVDRAGAGARVWDSNVVYGNWLEGTGSRNRTTRFKGYYTFRKTRAQVDSAAQPICDAVMRQYIGRLS